MKRNKNIKYLGIGLSTVVVESQSLTSVRCLLVLTALGERAVGAALFHFHNSSAGAAGKHKDMLV